MEMPKGFKTLKKRAKIPIVVEGEKKPRAIYTVPEINIACELMKEMAIGLEAILNLVGTPYHQFHKKDGTAIIEAIKVLNRFKEWK